MNKLRTQYLPALALVQVVLLVLTWLSSWILSLFVPTVQNLLVKEGVRWMLRNAMNHFAEMPIAAWLLCLMTWGVVTASGWHMVWSKVLHRQWARLTLRQRWGFQLSLLVIALCLLCILAGVLGQEPVLLSVTGQYRQSPLSQSILLLLCLTLVMASAVYGRVSGQFRHTTDVVQALAAGIAQWAVLFLNMFLWGQQWACLQYI